MHKLNDILIQNEYEIQFKMNTKNLVSLLDIFDIICYLIMDSVN